jgi:hypothetical protein
MHLQKFEDLLNAADNAAAIYCSGTSGPTEPRPRERRQGEICEAAEEPHTFVVSANKQVAIVLLASPAGELSPYSSVVTFLPQLFFAQ